MKLDCTISILCISLKYFQKHTVKLFELYHSKLGGVT